MRISLDSDTETEVNCGNPWVLGAAGNPLGAAGRAGLLGDLEGSSRLQGSPSGVFGLGLQLRTYR